MLASTRVRQVELKDDGDLRILTEGVEPRIRLMTADIVRIRAGFDGHFAEESYGLVTTAWEDTAGAGPGSVQIALPDDGEDIRIDISFDTFDKIGM